MTDQPKLQSFYKKMLLIRAFEEAVLELFAQGKLFGTTHAYIGQEANAVGVISALSRDDIVVSNHRCHGHYLTLKNNPYALLCEMLGKSDGLCAGRGGSQHICDGNFFSNGVQGGIVPLAAGLAFAEKFKNSGKKVAVFIGDGTLGEGVVYETLNIISKWKLPVLLMVENNRYAQSTKIDKTLSGSIRGRFEAFDIKATELTSFDVMEIHSMAEKVISEMEVERAPRCIVINTYRFASHSKSDDGRDPEEVRLWMEEDPLRIAESVLPRKFVETEKMETDVFVSKIVQRAIAAPIAS